jgi:hypothetical protein
MKKFNLCLTLIAVVMLVGLTNCKKDTEKTSVTKYIGTVNGSFVAQDASIKVNKDLDPSQLSTRTWIMYAKNSPFYGNQPFALVKGNEFITGSAAQQWWSKDGNNPVSFAASQAVYSNLTPAEPVRLIMEGYGSDSPKAAYLGILDFDPTAAQFPLAVTSKSLGDKLIVNADGLTSKPGGDLISVSVSFQAARVDLQATETRSQLSSGTNEGLATGVTGAFDFSDIVYNTPEPYYPIPVGHGDCNVWNDYATKIQGTITLTITFAPSPSAPGVSGSSIQLTTPAAGPGQYKKIVLTTSKLGWYDSATIGVNDQDISVDVTNISVDGTGGTGGGGNNGGGDQGTLPLVYSSILLNFSSPYPIYTGVADNPETTQLGISLIMDYPSAQAFIKSVGSSQQGGEIIDMGQKDLISLLQADHTYLPTGPPTTGYSSNLFFVVGHSYIIRYKKSINYLTSNASYHYGIFYVTNSVVEPISGKLISVTINYEGPFDN